MLWIGVEIVLGSIFEAELNIVSDPDLEILFTGKGNANNKTETLPKVG